MSNVKMMSTAMRTAAKAAAAAFGAFALGPAMASVASAAPAAQLTAPLHMGEAGSSGDSDSHGHNSNQLPEVGRQLPKAHTSNDHVEVHILPSRD